MKRWGYILAIVVLVVLVAVISFVLGEKAATPSIGTAAAPIPSSTIPTPSTTPITGTKGFSPPPPVTELGGYFSERTSPTLGTYLTDKNGRTLYTYSEDSPGSSNCTGACLQAWPPYGPGISDTGTFSIPLLPANINVIKGNLGMAQFTWGNMPLYYFSGDTKPGDTLGEGINGVWFVVKL